MHSTATMDSKAAASMTDSPRTDTDPEKVDFTYQMELQDVYEEGESGIDPVYHAKARVLNAAFQEIGMGKYQVSTSELLCHFGTHGYSVCNAAIAPRYHFVIRNVC